MKKYRLCQSVLLILSIIMLSLSSCEQNTEGDLSSLPYGENFSNEVPAEELSIEQPKTPVAADFGSFVGTLVYLDDEQTNVFGEGVDVAENTVTVKASGSYLFTGSFNGQIIVDADGEEKVHLCLDGVSVKSERNGAVAILSASAGAVVEIYENSVNILEDAEKYEYEENEKKTGACLFSKDDLRIEGEGELYVTSHSACGIRSKDTLNVYGGKIYITAGDDGIKGKDGVLIRDGSLSIIAAADGIKATNANDEKAGTVSIQGGTVVINAQDDGIDASGKITVTNGSISVLTGKGSSVNGQRPDGIGPGGGFGPGGGGFGPGGSDFGRGGGDFGQGRGGFDPGADPRTNPGQDSENSGGKGIKSDLSIVIDGGSVTVDSYDDSLHAAEGISILSGELNLSSGDDGIHCDKNVDISGGNVSVLRSYEGIEGQYITVSGGKTSVFSSDDGFNATDGSSEDFGMPGKSGAFRTGQDCLLKCTGGYTVVNASGDGIDSNGDIEQTGGTVIVFGPSDNGNGAIDYGDGRNNLYSFSGGTVLAIGSSGMMETVTSDLPSVALRTGNIGALTDIYILDASGNCVVAFKTPKAISSIVFASDRLTASTFSVYSGGTLPELTDNVSFFPETQPSGGTILKASTAR